MRTKRNSEAGYTLVIAIVLVGIIATLAGSVSKSFLTLAVIAARDQARFDAQNLNFYLRILFKSRSACTPIFINGDFGTELRLMLSNPSRASATNIRVGFPGSSTSQLIETNLRHESLRIISNRISKVARLPLPGDASYLVDMTMIYSPGSEPTKQTELLIPIYVTTTSTGALKDCFVTAMNQSTTAEDMLCDSLFEKRAIYSPQEGRCIEL